MRRQLMLALVWLTASYSTPSFADDQPADTFSASKQLAASISAYREASPSTQAELRKVILASLDETTRAANPSVASMPLGDLAVAVCIQTIGRDKLFSQIITTWSNGSDDPWWLNAGVSDRALAGMLHTTTVAIRRRMDSISEERQQLLNIRINQLVPVLSPLYEAIDRLDDIGFTTHLTDDNIANIATLALALPDGLYNRVQRRHYGLGRTALIATYCAATNPPQLVEDAVDTMADKLYPLAAVRDTVVMLELAYHIRPYVDRLMSSITYAEKQARAARIVSMSPDPVAPGETAYLFCEHHLPDEQNISVEWVRDGQRVSRQVPMYHDGDEQVSFVMPPIPVSDVHLVIHGETWRGETPDPLTKNVRVRPLVVDRGFTSIIFAGAETSLSGSSGEAAGFSGVFPHFGVMFQGNQAILGKSRRDTSAAGRYRGWYEAVHVRGFADGRLVSDVVGSGDQGGIAVASSKVEKTFRFGGGFAIGLPVPPSDDLKGRWEVGPVARIEGKTSAKRSSVSLDQVYGLRFLQTGTEFTGAYIEIGGWWGQVYIADEANWTKASGLRAEAFVPLGQVLFVLARMQDGRHRGRVRPAAFDTSSIAFGLRLNVEDIEGLFGQHREVPH